ncbi:MAG: hypothetical protein WKF95_19470 [Rubrobacter sp.]
MGGSSWRDETVYQGAQPLVERGVIVEPQALVQEPDLLLRLEEPPAFLLDQDLPEDPTQQVDVPPERLVFGLEPDPGGRSAYPALGASEDVCRIVTSGRVTLRLMGAARNQTYLYIGITGDRG